MKLRLFIYPGVVFFTFWANLLPAAEPQENVPYVLLRHSPRKKVFFLGKVMRSRSVKLSFLNNVQLTYVAPENAAVNGKIINSEGQIIRDGDIIAKARNIKDQIAVKIAEQKLKKSEQTLKDAILNLNRIEKLYKRHVFSERQHEEAEKEYLQARSDNDVCKQELLDAKEILYNKTLYAPFSGIIEKVFASAGSSLCDDQPVVVLSVFDPAYIKIQLHDVLTDLICIDGKFLVYPTGFTQSCRAWLARQNIFTNYILLSVKNRLISKWELTPEQEKLPKIYTGTQAIKLPEMSETLSWVPNSAVRQDGKRAYIWIASSNDVVNHIVTVKKIYVKPRNMFTQKRCTQYQAIEIPQKLNESQVVLMKISGNLVDGGKAVVYDYCWLFQLDEKVWVSIPELAKYVYTVPANSLKNFQGCNFIFIIGENGKIVPINVFVYSRSGKTVDIIGKNLTPGMKIICSNSDGFDYLGKKVKPGQRINF